MDWTYWYVFPYAVFVAITANASGFSRAVLFQPFFNFVLGLPIGQSVATGIATETIGMSSGASRYFLMKQIDRKAALMMLPAVLVGIVVGIYIFVNIPKDWLRLIVGVVVGTLAAYQLWRSAKKIFGIQEVSDYVELKKWMWLSAIAGASSACTATGVAEMHQPLFEEKGKLATKKANATAVLIEALADITITLFNLFVLKNIRFDILIFSATGVLIGGQIGALVSSRLPDRLLKTVFGVAVLFIGIVYIFTASKKLFF